MCVYAENTDKIIAPPGLNALVAAYGVTMDKSQAARVLGMKSYRVDGLSRSVLPRLRFCIGSSPVLYLTVDVWRYVQEATDGEKSPMLDVAEFLISLFGQSFGELMSREQVAMVLHVSPITVSRSKHDLLKPEIAARGRRGAGYRTSQICEYVLEGRNCHE